jgi:outer membrane protein
MSGQSPVGISHFFGVAFLCASVTITLPAWSADLLEVYQLARQNDPTLAGEHYQLEASEQTVPEAQSALLPVLSASSQLDRTGGDVAYSGSPAASRQYNSVIWTLQLTVPVLRPGSIQDLREAHATLDQARMRYALAEQDLLLRVAQGYFDVASGQEAVEAAQAETRATREQRLVASKSFQKGVVSVTDVDEAASRSELALSRELAANADLESKRTELAKIIGVLPTALTGLAKGSVSLAPSLDSMEEWAQRAAQNSLKVRSLQSAVQVAAMEVLKAQTQRLPTVDAIASYGRNYTSGNNTNPLDYGTNAHIKQAGVQFSIPILDAGGIHARVSEARAREHKAEADLEVARREAMADAREAYQGVLKGVAQVKALSAAIDASENSVKGSEAGYRAGLRINSDVLDAEREHYSARRDRARARYDTLLQFLKLKAAAGALRTSDLSMINSLLAAPSE